jgi:hypothetical protein
MAYDYSRHQQAIVEAQSLRVRSRMLLEHSLRIVAVISVARTQRMAKRRFPTPPWRAATALPKPRRFAMAGIVTVWDPARRELTMGERTVSVAAKASDVGLAPGRHVLLSGEQGDRRSPDVVTRIIVRPQAAA